MVSRLVLVTVVFQICPIVDAFWTPSGNRFGSIQCGMKIEVGKRAGTNVEKGSARAATTTTLEPASPLKEEDLRSKILRKPDWH